MAWRQNLGGSEQHLTRAAAAARTRTQRPGKHLAVHASELVVEPDFQILRRYRRPLLLRLEHSHRPNPGRLCPSRDATGQQSVTQSEDWYKSLFACVDRTFGNLFIAPAHPEKNSRDGAYHACLPAALYGLGSCCYIDPLCPTAFVTPSSRPTDDKPRAIWQMQRRASWTLFRLLLPPLLDDLDGARQLFVVLGEVWTVHPPRVLRPLPVLRRCHQKGVRRLVDHRHLPFANRFAAMLPASGDAPTRGGHSACHWGARRCRPTQKAHSCDRHHIARATAALVLESSIVNVTFDGFPPLTLSPAKAGLSLR